MADSNWSVRIGTRVTDDIQKQLDTMPKKTVTVKAVLDNTGLKTIGTTELTKYEDALGNVVVANKKFDASGKELNNTIKSVKSTVDTTSQTLQTASKHTKTLGQDFIDTAGKVAKFGAITAIFGLVTGAVAEAVNVVKEFDSAMTEFNKVSDISGSNLDSYTEKLGELGTEIARTRTQMVEASTEFVKSGYTEEQSAQLAKVAGLYQNVADSELTAGESSAYLISQMKAFNITATDAVSIIDKTNEVSNRFAVSSTDISTALTKTSSTFATYGNSIDETMAMVVGATELLPNQAGKVSKGLSSIGAEIVKLANESGKLEYNVKGVSKSLSLFDDAGNMLNTFDTLSAIKDDWDAMSKAEQSALALTLGMKTQIPVFTAEMNNFDTVLSAVGVSLGSTGSAMQENEAYMSSLEAKTNALKAQFELLVLGDGGLNSFIKGILDVGTSLLKFANSDIGQLTIKLIALFGTLTLLSKGFTLLKTKMTITATVMAMSTAINTLIFGIQALIVGAGTLTEVIGYLTTAMNINPLFIGATLIIGSIIGITKLIDLFTVSTKEATEAMSKSSQEYNTATSNIKSLESELESVNSKIKEIKSQGGAKTAREGELATLQAQSVELERQLRVQKELSEEARKQAEESAKKVLTNVSVGSGTVADTGEIVYQPETQVQQLQAITESIKALNGEKRKLDESYDSGDISVDKYKSQTADLDKEIADLTSEGITLSSTLSEATKNLTTVDNATMSLKNGVNGIIDGFLKLIDTSDNASSSTKNMAESTEEADDAIARSASRVEDINDRYKDSINSLSDLSGVYGLLTGAVDEYNSASGLSTDTILKLLSLSDEYLSVLQFENGQLSINENAMMGLIEARINDAKAIIAEKAEAQAAEVIHNSFNNTLNDGQTAASNASSALIAAGNSAITSAQKALSAASGWQSLWNTIQNIGGKLSANTGMDEAQRQADRIRMQAKADQAKYDKLLDELKSSITAPSGGGGGKRKGGGGGGGKSAETLAKEDTKTYKEQYQKQLDDLDHKLAMEMISEKEYYDELIKLNEQYFVEASGHHDEYLGDYQSNQEKIFKWQKQQQKELLEDTKDKYEKAFDYIKDTLEDQLDDLKEERDEELEYLDKSIDKIEEKKDAESDYWDEKIDAFKAQNQQLENQNELMRLQEALSKAEATQKMVMTDTGWDYGSDEPAVSDAQQAIDDYNQNLAYETQLAELEQSKEDALAIYDEKIADLEAYRESVSDNYDAQIKDMEDYIDDFEDMIDEYEKEQNKLALIQLAGTQAESENWVNRLGNLRNFVSEYKKLQKELADAEKKEYEKEEEASTPSGGGGTTSKPSKPSGPASDPDLIGRRASGDSSIKRSGAYLIGDSPNTELVIGSKLNQNSGVITSLSRGAGVVNAQSTKSLAGILNTLGSSMGLNGQTMGATTTNQSNATSQSIQIANITLPSVTNGQGLLDELRGFASGMLQTAYSNG